MKATLQTLFAQIRAQIARDELPAALSSLRGLLENTPQLKEVLQQSGRLQNIRRQMRTGTISQEDANLEQNRIRYGVLELLTELEQDSLPAAALGDLLAALEQESTQPELREEVEKAVSIVNSKNVVADSNITAGGNVEIGDKTTQNAEKLYNINKIGEANFIENQYVVSGPKTPRQLTATNAATPPSGLFGRKQELAEISQRLQSGRCLVLINGEGGIGKTALAAAYWEQNSANYQHIAWLFCENGILDAMRSLLPDSLDLRQAMNKVADKPEEQIQLIIKHMANLPKDSLLVLDHVNIPEHIKVFKPYFKGLGWQVLITSRCFNVLEDEEEYTIGSLPPEEAENFFRSNYDEKTETFKLLLERFLQAVGFNTLCIEMFSKTLKEGAGWDLDFASLLQKLESNGLKLGQDSFKIQTEWAENLPTEVANSDQVIQALYNTSSLTPKESELLAQLCLLPAQNHPPNILWSLLAPNDKLGLRDRLELLAQKGWLNSTANGYQVSAVVQKILLDKYAEKRWDLGAIMVERMNSFFDHEGYHSKNIAMAGLFAELVAGLVDNLGVVNKELANLYIGLWLYHNASGNLAKGLDTAERMRALCEPSEDKYNLSQAYELLGNTHRDLGNLNKALTFFEQSSDLAKEIHEASPHDVSSKNGLAIAYAKLGEIHRALGNLEQALTFFEKDLELSKECQKAFPQEGEFKHGLAIAYSKLGNTHLDLGNVNQALTFFEQYNGLEKELYEAFPQNVAFKHGLALAYYKLGNTHLDLGNLNQALTFFEQYNTLEKELHEALPQNVPYKNGLAIACAKLGGVYTLKKDFVNAKGHYLAYEKLAKELFLKDKNNVNFINGIAIANTKLGMTFLGLNEIEQAKIYFPLSNLYFEKLFKLSPENAWFKANYYQSLVVLASIQAVNGQGLDIKSIKEASEKFNEIAVKTQKSGLLKRGEIIKKMMEPGAAIKELIIQVSGFTI